MSKHKIVESNYKGERIDRYMSKIFSELSRQEAKRQISAGKVYINGRVVKIASRRVWEGDRLSWLSSEGDEELSEDASPFKMPSKREGDCLQDFDWAIYGGEPHFIFRDRHLAILDKPSGIPVEPTPKEDLKTCLRQVEALLRLEGVHPRRLYATAVHRLDAGASGVVAFATSKQAAKCLSRQFQRKEAKRVYLALVIGHLTPREGTIRNCLRRVGPGIRQGVVREGAGKLAITHYKVLQYFEEATLVEVRLETGRTHQIRVHFSHLGHPLVGDWLYTTEEESQKCPPAHRLFLHARSLTLRHPRTEEIITFESPIPEEMERYILQLTPEDDERNSFLHSEEDSSQTN